MKVHFCFIILDFQSFPWNLLTSVIAITISIFALIINRIIARRNLRLSIQQLFFKTVSEKAKDCNLIWENHSKPGHSNIKLISEIIISREIIEKSFDLFEINYKSIKQFKKDFYYLFWKQLNTGIRSFILNPPEAATKETNTTYQQQLADIKTTLSSFEK